MTSNQLTYWKDQESKRHNRAAEEADMIKAEAQRISAKANASQAAEAHRHNQVMELIAVFDAVNQSMSSAMKAAGSFM